MIWSKIYKFFDKLEDKVRGKLSHKPIIYGFIGGIGIVLFWRGVWHTADYLSELIYYSAAYGPSSFSFIEAKWWDGPLSFLIGSILLLITGLFVSSFIGNEIIITGLKGERKTTEKTEEELEAEASAISKAIKEIKDIEERVLNIEKILKEKK
ncbi:MAG: hypothetical protein ACP5QN_01100 [Minisyncoccia bacterium]